VTRSSRVAHALAVYLPGIRSAATRDQLWQQIEQRPAEREQALIALTWIADPRDLARIGDLLLQPGDNDPRGADLASLASHLVSAYGEAAIPHLRRALAESPYVGVRTQSAEQLALKGRVEAFRFFLDAITANRSYRPELGNWLRGAFRLPANFGESEMLAFLNEQIRNPGPPPAPQDSPVRAAVATLQSADGSARMAAAQALLDLATQSPQSMSTVGAYLVNDVIQRPAQVNADTWRDAALILGRLHHVLTAGLSLYLERDGATAALIDSGEPAVPVMTDVLKVGGSVRRRLAAVVLGAVGGAAARGALSAALKAEPDGDVKRAIQTALSQLGRRPPAADIR
jgi:hypothetical protein